MNGSCKHRWIGRLVLMGVLGWLCGCTSMPADVFTVNRTCDAEADAAVAAEQWQRAARRHEQVISSNPSNCLAMYHLGYIWGRLDDPSKEVAWYNKAVDCGYVHDDELFFNLGMALADMDRMEKAVTAFKKAVELRPDKADNHYGLAIALRAIGDINGAEQILKRAIAVSPSYWDARLLLARLYLDQGRLDAARPHLELVLQQAPDNETAKNLYRLYQERLRTLFE